MDKNKLILSTIMATLVAAFEYNPRKLEKMMGDKLESFDEYFKDFSENQCKEELFKLFNEYLSII